MNGCSVLIIEDELLIGMDMVYTLQRAGFPRVEHAATEHDALGLIERETWDAVVADANLNGCSIEHIAVLLRDKSVPFLVLTGYDRSTLPPAIGPALVLSKPIAPHKLVDSVKKLCIRNPQ